MTVSLNQLGAAAGSLMALLLLFGVLSEAVVWVARADDSHKSAKENQARLEAQVLAMGDLVQILGTKESLRSLEEEQLALLAARAEAAQEAEARAIAVAQSAVTARQATETAMLKKLCDSGALTGEHCT